MNKHSGVMIVCEANEGKLTSMATELLGGGRKLAGGLGQELYAVLIGSGISDLAQEAIAFGADKAYVIDDPLLEDYQADSFVPVMEKMAKQVMPLILLLGQTSIGRDLAPRLAFRLETAASLGCLDLSIDPESRRLLQTKPVYGSSAHAVFVCHADPQIATVRAKAMNPLERDESRKGEIVIVKAGLDPSAMRTKVLEKVVEEVKGIKLEDATVVVSGGRGIHGPEGFKQLEELANMLKGAVGASRPPCEFGWINPGAQIGLTGKIVAPDLYIAVGISGSSQHTAGCSGSKTIVAINKDPEANIFREAGFGVVGDWQKVLPAFMEKLKELVAG